MDQKLEGSLGVCIYPAQEGNDGIKVIPGPSKIGTWYHSDTTKIVPTLLHEMCHAIHNSQYGAMPLWLQEGIADWYSNRPRYLSAKAKSDLVKSYELTRGVLNSFDAQDVYLFLSATDYKDWDVICGDSSIGYVLSQSLIDMLIRYPQTQKIFIDGFKKAKAKSEWSGPRSKVFAENLLSQWPGGANAMLKGWRTWHGRLASQ